MPGDTLNTLMLMGTVAGSAFGVGYVVSEKIGKTAEKFMTALNETKESFTFALTEHRTEDQEKFGDHATRLGILEVDKFGFTHSGKNPDKMDPIPHRHIK